MAFNPREYLPLSRALDPPSAPPAEAAVRAAVGRSYYSAYNVAAARLVALGYRDPGNGSTHQWVIQRLKTASGPRSRDIVALGHRLASLFAARKLADYDLHAQSHHAPGKGFSAAVKAEQWIREFDTITDAELKSALGRF